MGERPNDQTTNTAGAGAQPAPQGTDPSTGVSRTLTTGTQPAPGTAGATTEPPGPKSQSEIGPTTYGAPGGPIAHGADDPITKEAYALGHPAHGIAAQRTAAGPQAGAAARLGAEVARGTFKPGQTNPGGATATPQGTTATPQGTTATSAQPGTAQTDAPQSGMQRLRMLRDEGGHTTGQEVTLPADEAQRLTASGAAQAI